MITSNARQPVRRQPSAPNGYDYQMPTPQTNVFVLTNNRNPWLFEYPWSNKLCSCCTDVKQCCYAFFCPCCFVCQLYKRTGENMCTCLCPGSLFALRAKIRTAFRIEGTLWQDCCVSLFCPCCSSIQMAKEIQCQGL